jgi:hypothetical protein
MKQFGKVASAQQNIPFHGLQMVHQVILVEENVKQAFAGDLVGQIDRGFQSGNVVVSQD